MNKITKIASLIGGVILCFFLFDFITNKQIQKNDEVTSSLKPEIAFTTSSNATPLKKNTQQVAEQQIASIESGPEADPNYIVECDVEQITDYQGMSNGEIFASFDSSLSEHKQLAYALFSDLSEQASRLDKLFSFNQRFPNNSLALEQILGLCTENKGHQGCNQQLVEQAISVGGDNAAMWFAVANFHASRNALDLVKDALRQVNSAPLFEESFADYIGLYIDSLQGRPNENFTRNALSAFGAAATQPSFFNIISKLCTDKPKQDVEFLQLCLSLGQTMEFQGKTNITQNIGMAYQEVIYELEGNDLALKELELRREKHFEHSIFLFHKATNLALFDQRLFRSWLENLRNLGEQAAARLVIEEAIELSKNTFYQPCP
ncbi:MULTISPECIES: hypothetical protein [Aliiglaciecola]|uniref:hypothetical protein n=1 Tax=Aliiglaciecola TaxID=1406885 RepID=UPI001C0868AB|nr:MULTISPECIES: hypothetical protein [Aliiglaciecola]MBU2878785.1 hypothetical protein [Aliiglaciecola lipolytica]MDO6711317.1 hypothetical protein [Aliiglaciecola sp. 2_MG-2023]MDO6752234.1 hypothetical protein [Aliiglaciecola sp. 1_MG-2023]